MKRKLRTPKRIMTNQPETDASLISELPDALIHHIYSFLDMKSVVRTSVLSTRWKNLWRHTPTLDFHLDQNPIPKSFIRSVENPRARSFVNFVESVFRLHNFYIQKFSLSSYEYIEPVHISEWIRMATARNVQELHLSLALSEFDVFELPQNVFTSVQLLTLQRCPLPSWVCSANLIKSLKLVSVKLPNGDSGGHLDFSCPVLESLILTFCGISHLETLTVSTPLLKNLELNTAITCIINISCPNLLSFECYSFVYEILSFSENPSSLLSAVIDMYPYDDTEEGKVFYGDCLRNVMGGICTTRSLTLRDSFLKTMLDHSDSLDRVPNMFQNLRYMLVKDWNYGVCIHNLANISKRLPCIETLVWERNQGFSSQIKENFQFADISSVSRFCSLETFEIRNFQAGKDELLFVKCLLTSAPVLKKIVFKINRVDVSYESKLTDFKLNVFAVLRRPNLISTQEMNVQYIQRGKKSEGIKFTKQGRKSVHRHAM